MRALTTFGLAFAIAAMVAPPTLAKGGPKGPCWSEAKKYCGGGSPEPEKAKCLTSRMEQLVPACRAYIEKAQKQ